MQTNLCRKCLVKYFVVWWMFLPGFLADHQDLDLPLFLSLYGTRHTLTKPDPTRGVPFWRIILCIFTKCMGKRESAVRKKAPSSNSSQNKSAEAPFQLLAALEYAKRGGIDRKGWYHMALALSIYGWREVFFSSSFGLTDCSQFISLSLLLRSFLPMPYQKKKKKKKALFAVSLRRATTCLSPHTLDKKNPTYWIRIRISNEAKLSGAVIRERCCRLPCKKYETAVPDAVPFFT